MFIKLENLSAMNQGCDYVYIGQIFCRFKVCDNPTIYGIDYQSQSIPQSMELIIINPIPQSMGLIIINLNCCD